MKFIDVEKDYANIEISDKLKDNSLLNDEIRKPKENSLKVKYTHNPYLFDNSAKLHPKGDGIWKAIEGIADEFVVDRALTDMRGEWTLSIQGSDDTGNLEYDKYSDIKSLSFIIHEKPVAKIKMHEDQDYIYLDGGDSYDVDFQFSLPDRE